MFKVALPIDDNGHRHHDADQDARANHNNQKGEEILSKVKVGIDDKSVDITDLMWIIVIKAMAFLHRPL